MANDPLNLLFIMPDQLRADFVGCYGVDYVQTPHIDGLAARGVRYDCAVSPSPLCVPARAALLTGYNGLKTGVLNNPSWLHPQRRTMGLTTWPEQLAARGYTTAAIGKMHFYPWDASEGFQIRRIAEDKRHLGIQDDYAVHLQQHGLRRYHGNEHDHYHEHQGAIVSRIPAAHQVDQWVADETCRFIAEHDTTTPFAMMVGLPGPHCPYDPVAEWLAAVNSDTLPAPISATPESDAFRAGNIAANIRPWNGVDYTVFHEQNKRRIRQHYTALVQHIDRCVGQMMAALAARGLAERTVVIFSSDHGDFLGDYDLIGKHLFYDPAIRVPLIVSHPAHMTASTHREIVSLTDVTATLLALGGGPLPTGNDSVPLPGLPNIEARARDAVFGATNLGVLADDGVYKLARYGNGQRHLFHRPSDPTEQHNLIDQAAHRAAQQRLDAVIQREVIAGAFAGHQDKRVDAAALDPDSTFARRGWQRPYPAPEEPA